MEGGFSGRRRDDRLFSLRAASSRPSHAEPSYTVSQDCTEERKVHFRRLYALSSGPYQGRPIKRRYSDLDSRDVQSAPSEEAEKSSANAMLEGPTKKPALASDLSNEKMAKDGSGPRQVQATPQPSVAYSDATGQMQPRLTATLWEDEGTLCFQVDARGVVVARREDNDMINGTKLLNVAGMARGRRDGILKSEKIRHVVKVGPMHLKGVWIPFERALDMAIKEKITELLYPLFAHNNIINSLLSAGSKGAPILGIAGESEAAEVAKVKPQPSSLGGQKSSTQV